MSTKDDFNRRLPFFQFMVYCVGENEKWETGCKSSTEFWSLIHSGFELYLGYKDKLNGTIQDYNNLAKDGYWNTDKDFTIHFNKKFTDYVKVFE